MSESRIRSWRRCQGQRGYVTECNKGATVVLDGASDRLYVGDDGVELPVSGNGRTLKLPLLGHTFSMADSGAPT